MGSNESKNSKTNRKKVKKRRNSKSVKEIVTPARKIAIRILEDMLDTQEFREQIGNRLDKTLKGINAIFYEDKGSFEMIVAAIILAYDLDETSLGDFGVRIRAAFRQQTPNAQLDHAWQELDKYCSYKEKQSWLAAMQAYAHMMKNGSGIKK